MAVVTNLGTGGSVLDAQYGSTVAPNTNEPLLLPHAGTNYLYTGGALGWASLPDANYAGAGDFSIRVRAAASWQTTSFGALLGNTNQASTGFRLFTGNGAARLGVSWYDSGTSTFRTITANADNPVGMATDALIWIRVDFDRDNGSSQCAAVFYWAGATTEPTSWTQIGTTVTQATVAAPAYTGDGRGLGIGSQTGDGNTNGLIGSYYRVIIYTDLTQTTKVLDADFTTGITSGAQTTFTESSTNAATVTINRSTSGRKSCAVVRPVWLLGTDDFFEVADNALLDFGASDSFTVVAVARQWGTPANFGRYVDKASNLSGLGYGVSSVGTTAAPRALIYDSLGNSQRADGSTATAGAVALFGMVLDRTAQTIRSFTNGTLSAAASTTGVGSLANTFAMRIGSFGLANTNFQDFECYAVAVFRRALTADELSTIAAYYGAS